jgi:hypothetical protein
LTIPHRHNTSDWNRFSPFCGVQNQFISLGLCLALLREAYAIYDHGSRQVDVFSDPGRALARAAACRGACAVAAVGAPAK